MTYTNQGQILMSIIDTDTKTLTHKDIGNVIMKNKFIYHVSIYVIVIVYIDVFGILSLCCICP